MKTFNSEIVTAFDCDETLVMWSWDAEHDKDAIEIMQPMENGPLSFNKLVPNKPVIERLKGHAAQGHTIIVWSAGGGSWAEAVVKALDLEKFVSACMSKPQFFYDDLPAVEWLSEVNRYHLDYRTGARKK